jgi:hypothetical protein
MNQKLAFNTAISLGEALQNMRDSEVEDNFANKTSADVAQALEQHDAVHILFSRRMHKKLAVEELSILKGKSILAIRQEYGIVV